MTASLDIELLTEAIEYSPKYEWFPYTLVTEKGVRAVIMDETRSAPNGVSYRHASATWGQVGEALARFASGFYTDYAGNPHTLGNQYVSRAARDFLFNPDEVDYDSDVVDMLLQEALLGGQIYG